MKRFAIIVLAVLEVTLTMIFVVGICGGCKYKRNQGGVYYKLESSGVSQDVYDDFGKYDSRLKTGESGALSFYNVYGIKKSSKGVYTIESEVGGIPVETVDFFDYGVDLDAYNKINFIDDADNDIELVIPEGVKSIYFDIKARGIKRISIPKSVVCVSGLEKTGVSLMFENGIYYYGDWAIMADKSYNPETIEVREGTVGIAEKCFKEKSAKSVVLPESLKYIGAEAFGNMKNLEEADLKNARHVGDFCFISCKKLSEIKSENKIEKIGTAAFYQTAIKDFDFSLYPQNKYHEYAFLRKAAFNKDTVYEGTYNYSNHSSAHSSFEYRSINKGVFNSSSLESVTFNEKTTEIPEECFANSKLSNITIPAEVSGIGVGAFSNCKNLSVVEFEGKNTGISKNTFENCVSLYSIELPQNLKMISESMFSGCKALRNINIPLGVTTIANMAFKGCSSLSDVEIPDSVTGIGHSCFQDCSSLESAIIGKNVTFLSENLFKGTRLRSVVVGENIDTIYPRALDSLDGNLIIEFVKPNGWAVYNSIDSTSGTNLSASELENSTTAVSLYKRFNDKVWKREKNN